MTTRSPLFWHVLPSSRRPRCGRSAFDFSSMLDLANACVCLYWCRCDVVGGRLYVLYNDGLWGKGAEGATKPPRHTTAVCTRQKKKPTISGLPTLQWGDRWRSVGQHATPLAWVCALERAPSSPVSGCWLWGQLLVPCGPPHTTSCIAACGGGFSSCAAEDRCCVCSLPRFLCMPASGCGCDKASVFVLSSLGNTALAITCITCCIFEAQACGRLTQRCALPGGRDSSGSGNRRRRRRHSTVHPSHCSTCCFWGCVCG